MKCIKILLLVSLIPLVLRGVSLLGNVVPASSDQPPSSSDNGAGGVSSSGSASRVGRGRGHLPAGGFAQRRFGGDGGGGGFFMDDKRFSPTGSNPLHNL